MFLIANKDQRHLLFDKFSELVNYIVKHGKYNVTYYVTLLEPGNPGKYDINLSLMTEKISGGTYVTGKIVKGQNNMSRRTSDIFNLLFVSIVESSEPACEGVSMPLHKLYPLDLVKGKEYIDLKDVDKACFSESRLDELFQSKPNSKTPPEEAEWSKVFENAHC